MLTARMCYGADMPRRKSQAAALRGPIYGRQSKTSETSESLATQRGACLEAADRHRVEVMAELFEAPSTSAYRRRGLDRPRWGELLDMIRSGQANCVVAYKTDRLSRGGGPGWAPLLDAAEAAGLDLDRFVLIGGSGFMSEFEIGIRATMDREESRKASERLCDMKERMAADGRPSGGGSRGFGYARDGMTVIEAEAAMIKDAAARFLTGDSLSSICREWNHDGLTTSVGHEWRVTPLRNLLVSHRIAGLRVHGVDDQKQPVVVDEAKWPAIIDRSTHEQLRRVLLDPGRRRTKTGSVHLLTGILRCGLCASAHGERLAGRSWTWVPLPVCPR